MKIISSLAVLILLNACVGANIWNAGDLAKWVRKQAVKDGCESKSIELDNWYHSDQGKNIWSGNCTHAESGKSMRFNIPVDKVWTPSSAQ